MIKMIAKLRAMRNVLVVYCKQMFCYTAIHYICCTGICKVKVTPLFS